MHDYKNVSLSNVARIKILTKPLLIKAGGPNVGEGGYLNSYHPRTLLEGTVERSNRSNNISVN